jgi:hypothetical protein
VLELPDPQLKIDDFPEAGEASKEIPDGAIERV